MLEVSDADWWDINDSRVSPAYNDPLHDSDRPGHRRGAYL